MKGDGTDRVSFTHAQMAVSSGKFELPERPSHPQVPEKLDLGSDHSVGLENRSQPETDDAFQAWIRSLLDWKIDGICDTKRHTSPQITNPLDEEKRLPDWQSAAGNFSRSSRGCGVTRDGTLNAQCQMLDGDYHFSSMSLKSVIMGLNGEFHWLDGTIRFPSCQILDASNWNFVEEREVKADSLHMEPIGFWVLARCMDDSGEYKMYALALDERISNDNGRLKLITPLGPLNVPLLTDYHVSTIAIALVMGIKHLGPNVQSEDIELQVQSFLQNQYSAQSSKCPLAESLDAKAATLISLMWIRFCREYAISDLINYRDICKAIDDRLRDQPPPSHELEVLLEHYREMPSHLKRHAMGMTKAVMVTSQKVLIHEAIDVLRMLLVMTAEDDEQKSFYGQMLIDMVLRRYKATSEYDDLRQASALAEEFHNTDHRDGNHKAFALMVLGQCKWEEDRLSGEKKNERFIVHALEEAERCSTGLSKIATRQNACIYHIENLSTFEPFDHAELHRKFEWLDVAPTATAAEGDEVPPQIAIAHWRYKAAGPRLDFEANPEDITLIDKAIEYTARSKSACEDAKANYALSDEVFANTLVAHAQNLAIRFKITEASDDLSRIIEAYQKALTLYGSTSKGRADILHDLAVHQLLLHERESALKTCGDGKSSTCRLLLDAFHDAKAAYESPSKISDAYGLFAHTFLRAWELCAGAVGDWSFLDEAIRIAEDSHTRILHKKSACTLLESTKCRLLFQRYLIRRSPSAYDEAMDAVRRHSQRDPLTTIDGPHQVVEIMGSASAAFKVKANSAQEKLPCEDVAFMAQQCEQILNLNRAQARYRIKAGIELGFLRCTLNDWVGANKAYEKTINLFTRLITRSLSPADREYLLKRFSTDLPTKASFAAYYAAKATSSSAEEVALATLQRLESSRGILARLVFRSRLNLELFRSEDENAADQYDGLLKQLNSLETPASIEERKISSSNDDMRKADVIQKRTKIAELLSRLEDNLKAKTSDLSVDFLRGLVNKSALVHVVVDSDIAIAILVTAAGLSPIKLQELKASDITKNLGRLYGHCRLSKAKPLQLNQAGQELREILKWLWDKAVKLILSELGYYPQPKRCHCDRLPRLWWCASGTTSKLPFHAAGEGAEGVNSENVYDYAVCSFTPSLTALKIAQDCTAPSEKDFNESMLAVSMPTTPGPGWVPLKAEEELRSIKDSSGLTPTCLTNPRKFDVLERLSEHSIIHFICHGTSITKDPSSSALILGQQSANYVERLTVKELGAIGLKKARLAYLSACSTAENSSYELSDESIHLASAFQLAGFSHVIGAFWEVKGRGAIPLAGLFYQNLIETFVELETFDSNHDVIAYALHNALCKVRKSTHNPLCWAPFVHLGA